MLKQIGIFGYSKLEPAIKTALITGDPLLFIGKHGTAKTALCRNLAALLGLEYHAYDASKAMFEDIIGFPDPASLKDGSISYIPTPMSIWGKEFILIDEISRAQPALQNKWMEIIRSRSVMGMPLDDLRFVFAAMNPVSYIGSNTLDEALAGRFAVILNMPDIMDMDESDMESVITAVGCDDAVAIKRNNVIGKSQNLLNEIDIMRSKMTRPDMDSPVSALVMKIINMLSEKDIHIDGRRAGMIFRNIKARLIMEGKYRISADSLADTLSYSLPCGLSSESIVINYKRLAGDVLRDERSLFFRPDRPLKSLSNLEYCGEPATADLIIMNFLEKFKAVMSSGKSRDIARYIHAYFKVFEYVNANSDILTLNTVELIMGGFKEHCLQGLYKEDELNLELKNNSKNAAEQIALMLTGRDNEGIEDLKEELSAIMEEAI